MRRRKGQNWRCGGFWGAICVFGRRGCPVANLWLWSAQANWRGGRNGTLRGQGTWWGLKVVRTLWGAPESGAQPERSSKFWRCSSQEGGGSWGAGTTGWGMVGHEVSVEGKDRDLAPAVGASWDCWVDLGCVGQEWCRSPACRHVAGREGVKAWSHPGHISAISALSFLPWDQSQRRNQQSWRLSGTVGDHCPRARKRQSAGTTVGAWRHGEASPRLPSCPICAPRTPSGSPLTVLCVPPVASVPSQHC